VNICEKLTALNQGALAAHTERGPAARAARVSAARGHAGEGNGTDGGGPRRLHLAKDHALLRPLAVHMVDLRHAPRAQPPPPPPTRLPLLNETRNTQEGLSKQFLYAPPHRPIAAGRGARGAGRGAWGELRRPRW
jgi:hypothetical protein